MSTYIGIELQGNQINYAEISNAQRTLVQLGTLNFAFDVEQVFFDENSPQLFFDEINTALTGIFQYTEATEVRFTLHPRFSTVFYTPVGTEIDIQERAVQFLQEARNLSGKHNKALHIVPVPLFIEDVAPNDGVIWYQIMAVEKHIFNQAAKLLKGLLPTVYKFQSASTDVAKLIAVQTPETPAPDAPFILTIGCFSTHLELMICRKENLHFTTFNFNNESIMIQVQNTLKQMNLSPSVLHQIYLYGNSIRPEYHQLLKQAVPVKISTLNVLAPLFNVEIANAADYTVCVGAAL